MLMPGPLPMLALSLIPEGLSPAVFLFWGVLSVVVFGAAKAGFGGLAVVSTPLMVYACGGQAKLAAGIMLPLLIVTDYVTLAIWWGHWDLRQVARLLPGALAGVATGAMVLWGLQRLGQQGGSGEKTANAALAMLIGLIALAFIALQIWRERRGLRAGYRPNLWHATGFGYAAGVTSTISHSAGPVMTMYLLPQQLPKDRFAGTMVAYFWTINQVKLVPYGLLGMLSAPSLGADLLLLPAVGAGVVLGIFLHRRISQVWFTRVIYVLLGAIGLHLTIGSALTLWKLLSAGA